MKINKIHNLVAATAVAMALTAGAGQGMAQEFRATVEVNAQQIEGTNKNVFETLKEALNTYMNETKFSDATFSPNEKIECRLFFTIAEYADDRMKGTCRCSCRARSTTAPTPPRFSTSATARLSSIIARETL